MANRFLNPVPQFADSAGEVYALGKLYFYVTGTTTPADTYSDSTLETENTNPVVLDSAGRCPEIFLDPAVTYRAILKTAADVEVWDRDPVVDPAAGLSAAFRVSSGDPNGSYAGTAGTVGGASADAIWDISNSVLWVCSTTGTSSTAVWTQIAAQLTGAIVESGILTPSAIGANQDDYAPTGIATASLLRVQASAAYNITGIAASDDGRVLELMNVGSYAITLKNADTGSAAANRFAFGSDIVLAQYQAIHLKYDATLTRWVATASFTRLATQAEAQAGTSNVGFMTPLRVLEAIASLATIKGIQAFTTAGSGTYTPTTGATKALLILIGPGGNGGTGSSGTGGGGGGAGEIGISLITSLASVAYTVGGPGTATQWDTGGTPLTAAAGSNGTNGSSVRAAGGAGGTGGSNCDIYIPGADGRIGWDGSDGFGGDGGGSLFGSGGAGARAPGTSGSTAGEDATVPGTGGGGGGANSSYGGSSGDGADGMILVIEFAGG